MAEIAAVPLPLAALSLPPLSEKTLENGLDVVAAERPRSPVCSASLVFRAGSARDPKGKAGLADFVVELLRRGTKKRPASAIDEALELMGADLRLDTSSDSTVVSVTVPSEHLEPALALVAEIIRAPAFEAREVLSARKRTVAALQTDLDDPPTLAAQALYRAALGNHPYAHSGRGTRKDVATFNRGDCLAWHQRWIRPAGSTLVLAGDLPGAEAVKLAESLFGTWKGPVGVEAPLPPVPPIEGHPILLVDKPEATQAQIRLASNGPERLYPDIVGARVSALMLGGGFTSRLVDAIRVTRGLSYGVSAYMTETEAGGLFVVSSYTKTSSVRELIDVALSETARYRDEGPTAEELTRAQRYTNGLYPLSLETVDQLARALADLKRFGRSPDWLERYRERVQAVDAASARAQARWWFLSQGWAAAVVGDAKALRKQLQGLGRVQVVPAERLA
ncbi:MAG TPA: pitrilysin family protein [Myxococcales bacterium]|jgi:zinc protease